MTARRIALGTAALTVALSRWLCAARVPDDYDSIGFMRAVTDFDLARLQPHFPGYPVYVGLTRGLHWIVPSPLAAATGASALAAGATVIAVWLGARTVSERAAWLAVAFYSVASLPWLLGGAALSDMTATALAAFAFAALLRGGPLGAFIGAASFSLMLGARASYWPLGLVGFGLAFYREPLRALAGSMLGLAAWLVPFALVVGRPLFRLGRTHLHGHFTEWGGSIATRPGLGMRTGAALRALFWDGLSPSWFLVAAAALVLIAWRGVRPSRQKTLLVALVATPYLLWVLFGQNILDQPRHMLPLVVGLAALLGCATQAQPLWALGAVALLLAGSLPLARAHATEAPAAATAAAWVSAATDPPPVAVFGGRSLRFFRDDPTLELRERTWLAEIEVDLARFQILPRTIWVTSEVSIDAARASRLTAGPTFCRDARLDRAQPCLQLFRYTLPGRAR